MRRRMLGLHPLQQDALKLTQMLFQPPEEAVDHRMLWDPVQREVLCQHLALPWQPLRERQNIF